jgi:hypothetical protein
VGHHYFANCGTDREARGTLRDFRRWTTGQQGIVDSALAAAGAKGKHGDRDGIAYSGSPFSLVEANLSDSPFSWANWRAYLYDHNAATARQLAITTAGRSTSFANPSVTRLTDPAGRDVLLVSIFLPSEGAAAGEAGQRGREGDERQDRGSDVEATAATAWCDRHCSTCFPSQQ